MARITVQDVYNGAKYDVMSATVADYLKNGRPDLDGYATRKTRIDCSRKNE